MSATGMTTERSSPLRVKLAAVIRRVPSRVPFKAECL